MSSSDHPSAPGPKAVLERLVQACGRVAQATKDSKEAQEPFRSTYQLPFQDLFVRVGSLARDRKELSSVLDALETAWTSALPGVAAPKIPQKKKPFFIYPETSFEDALKLIDKNMDDYAALMTIVNYLQGALKDVLPKKLKSLPYEAKIKTVLASSAPAPMKEAYTKLLRACDDKVAERDKAKVVANPKPAQTAAATTGKGKQPAAKQQQPSSLPGSNNRQQPSAKRPDTDEKKAPPKKRPMTQEEFEREFLRRARESVMRDEMEDLKSRRIGAKEDAEADLG